MDRNGPKENPDDFRYSSSLPPTPLQPHGKPSLPSGLHNHNIRSQTLEWNSNKVSRRKPALQEEGGRRLARTSRQTRTSPGLNAGPAGALPVLHLVPLLRPV